MSPWEFISLLLAFSAGFSLIMVGMIYLIDKAIK